MNRMEIVFFITFILSGLRFFVPQLMGRRGSAALSLPSLVMLLILLFTGTLRWTMISLYGLSLLLIVNDVVFFVRGRTRKSRLFTVVGVTLRTLVVLFALASVVLSSLFPITSPEAEKLPHPVGSRSLVLTDTTRKMGCGDTGDFRTLAVQFWYPAGEGRDGGLKPWLEDGHILGPLAAREVGVPGFVLSHAGLIPSRSRREAPLAGANDFYPVVIISHGWKGFREIHTDLAEMLASRGFLVVAPDHTCGSLAVDLPEIGLVTVDETLLPKKGAVSSELRLERAARVVEMYSADQLFLLDRLEDLQSGAIPSFLEGRMDLSQTALLAHSTGGGAAVLTAGADERVGALALMDPWVEPLSPEILRKGLDQPLFVLGSQEWSGSDNEPYLHLLLQSARNEVFSFRVEGTSHVDFTASRYFTPTAQRWGALGSLDQTRSAQIIGHSILNFLTRWAGGEPEGVLENLSVYFPEFRQEYLRLP